MKRSYCQRTMIGPVATNLNDASICMKRQPAKKPSQETLQANTTC